MPVKRQISKKHAFEAEHLEELLYGPGTNMLNGYGYLGDYGDGTWQEKSLEIQAVVLEMMRDDWCRYHASVLAAWDARTPHDLTIANEYYGNPDVPWAATQFGEFE